MTTPLPLTGIGVVVTRPEQQAGPLCRLLEARGRILTAPSADDQDVLAELLRWRAAESGA